MFGTVLAYILCKTNNKTTKERKMKTIKGTIEINARKVAREYLRNEFNECDLKAELMNGEKHYIDIDIIREYGNNTLDILDYDDEDDDIYWEELMDISKLAKKIIEKEVAWAREEFNALFAKINKRW